MRLATCPLCLVALALCLLLDSPPRSGAAEHVAPPAKYRAAVKALEAFIAEEVADKGLPALSIALVDDQDIVWAGGFGYADAKKKTPATPETVYRVGSVSKLFTDIAVMQLVERGELDLDAPVTRYLPDFKPENPFGRPITLRHLMAHRSGLVREPPVGNYFDPTHPPLAKSVRSLNDTRLVYKPGAKIKYSNAAIAVVGYVLERTQKEPFARYVKRAVLDPIGLKKSGFEPTPALTKDLASAVMWTYHGREFAAPTFELGMAPAGSMYSTVTDLGRFLSVLFAGGRGPRGRVLKRDTLEAMWKPQFAKKDEKVGFGIGFQIAELEGRRRVGHGGAIYGFATELAALPDDKLGVVVVTSKDVANAVTKRIADTALKQMLAARRGKPLPKIERTEPLSRGELERERSEPPSRNRLAGRWGCGHEKGFDLIYRSGKLWLLPHKGGFRAQLRRQGNALVTDDVLDFGQLVVPHGDKFLGALSFNGEEFTRGREEKPKPAPAKWAGLTGEYGWDHNTLYILEKDGKLHALIEWFFLYPLEAESDDVYKFPDFGLYHGEKLIFTRDRKGRATQVEAASVVFKRRPLPGEGETFRIRPARPIDELRREALAARPPREKGEFRDPDLVDLTTLDFNDIKLDIRYAGTNNFLGTPFYTSAKAYLQRPAAEALRRAHWRLMEEGYGLLIHDAYRPWHVTKMFWEATPPKFRLFVADPSQGSRHNRGCAVDLTLYDRKTGKAVQMVGGFDEFSDRSYPEYPGGTSLQRWHRDLLRRAMEAEGFTVYEAEWWHFDYRDWRKYPILNRTFEQLGKARQK